MPKTQPVSRGGENHSPQREHRNSLVAIVVRDKLLLMFCCLALIAIIANVKFVVDVSNELSEISSVSSTQANAGNGSPGKDRLLLDGFRSKMFVLLGIMVVSFGSIILLYAVRVVEPLHSLSLTVKEISKGNLSLTAPADGRGDIGQLGAVINDLAANFQEVLLLTGTTAGNSRCSIEAIEKTLDLDENSPVGHQLQEQVEAIKKDLELLDSVVQEFEFYHARFDGRKVVPLSSRPKT